MQEARVHSAWWDGSPLTLVDLVSCAAVYRQHHYSRPLCFHCCERGDRTDREQAARKQAIVAGRGDPLVEDEIVGVIDAFWRCGVPLEPACQRW